MGVDNQDSFISSDNPQSLEIKDVLEHSVVVSD